MFRTVLITIIASILGFYFVPFSDAYAVGSSTRISPPLTSILSESNLNNSEVQEGSVTLRKISKIDSSGDGDIKYTEYVALKIFSKSAADDYSKFELSFNSYYRDIHLDFARIISKEGEIFEVNDDAWKIEDVQEKYIFSDLKKLSFSLPAVSEDTVIEYQVSYTTKRKKIKNNWSRRIEFHNVHFSIAKQKLKIERTLDSSIILVTPKSEYINFNVKNINIKPEKRHTGNNVERIWHAKNLKAYELEESMPTLDKILPILYVTSIKDWTVIDEWATNIYWSASKIRPKVQELAIQLSKNKKTELEKIKAVYSYMENNIRYIGADFNRGGYIPHNSDIILKNRYGDCKDQSVLMVSLFTAMGIRAYPALVNPYPGMSVDKDIPSLNFSHMIIYLPDNDLWLDTSGSAAQYPGISSSLEGRVAFLINGKGGALKTINKSTADQNRIVFTGEYQADGEDLIYHIDLELYGEIENSWRSALIRTDKPERAVLKLFQEIYSSREVSNITISDYESLVSPLKISADINMVNNVSDERRLLNFKSNLFSISKLFLPLDNILKSDEREFQYQMGVSYKFSFVEKYSSPSEDFNLIVQKTAQNQATEYFNASHKYNKNGDTIQIESEFIYFDYPVKSEEFKKFQTQLKNTVGKSEWILSYIYDEDSAKNHELSRKVNSDSVDTKVMLDLAQHHLNMGEYEKVITISRNVLKLNNKNGRAHYLLGITLGFMDKYEESEGSLKQAEKLGYVP